MFKIKMWTPLAEFDESMAEKLKKAEDLTTQASYILRDIRDPILYDSDDIDIEVCHKEGRASVSFWASSMGDAAAPVYVPLQDLCSDFCPKDDSLSGYCEEYHSSVVQSYEDFGKELVELGNRIIAKAEEMEAERMARKT